MVRELKHRAVHRHINGSEQVNHASLRGHDRRIFDLIGDKREHGWRFARIGGRCDFDDELGQLDLVDDLHGKPAGLRAADVQAVFYGLVYVFDAIGVADFVVEPGRGQKRGGGLVVENQLGWRRRLRAAGGRGNFKGLAGDEGDVARLNIIDMRVCKLGDKYLRMKELFPSVQERAREEEGD